MQVLRRTNKLLFALWYNHLSETQGNEAKYSRIKDLNRLVFPLLFMSKLSLESMVVPEASDEEATAHAQEPQGAALYTRLTEFMNLFTHCAADI